jgi:hypothetical protein
MTYALYFGKWMGCTLFLFFGLSYVNYLNLGPTTLLVSAPASFDVLRV